MKGKSMFDKLKALKDMQQKIQEMKKQLELAEFEVESRDGRVKIKMTGTQEIKDIKIKCNLPKDEADSLREAIKDALKAAVKCSHDVAADKMKGVTGMNLPGMP
jgi:DNA-binding YbaB/EbfC family protein